MTNLNDTQLAALTDADLIARIQLIMLMVCDISRPTVRYDLARATIEFARRRGVTYLRETS